MFIIYLFFCNLFVHCIYTFIQKALKAASIHHILLNKLPVINNLRAYFFRAYIVKFI